MHGKITWESPSNIALIKYWGKYGDQLPQNPSLSITLRQAISRTTIQYQQVVESEVPGFSFLFEGKPRPDFEARLSKYLHRFVEKYPVLSGLHLDIQSSNTFPHSSGIASSASAYSALALALLSVVEEVSGHEFASSEYFAEASEWARLGSGSASRSVYGGFVVWGETEGFPEYTNRYAVPVSTVIHPAFHQVEDAILMVNEGTKKVGSSAGHQLMEANPYAATRYRQAQNHVIEMHEVLTAGDMDRFIEIVEQEALTLHAMMMASQPGYLLLESGTLSIIERVRRFREETKIPVCFTLDAGPNVHLLYPKTYKKEILDLINRELLLFCTSHHFLDDGMGEGPVKVIHQE